MAETGKPSERPSALCHEPRMLKADTILPITQDLGSIASMASCPCSLSLASQ